ncbi:hypothetical protein NQ318_022590 [Aromia moschata]|uniref:Uncharacterized protein n=1 Tax=Aromia moschata TaxID=1265417 RepID=A0AAV8XWH5_9CUCU|nr:hypothetical protein NQ318_022590 [Aromia moschata]
MEEKESCNSVPPKYEDEKLLKKDTVNITGFKRHSNNDDDSNLTIKRKIHSVDQSQLQSEMLNSLTVNKSMHNNTADKNCITEAVLIEESNHTLNNIQNEAHAVIEDVNIDVSKEQRANLQTSPLSNSNILYSEPMKVKLMARSLAPIPDLCDNLNLQSFNSSLNLKLRSSATPATSFHITLSDMSPCVEDTQQLIYATFSKPDQLSLKECLQGHSSVSFNKEKYDFLKTPEKSGGSQHPNSNDGFKGDNQTYECTNSVCKTPKFTNKTCVVEGKVEHTSDTVSLVKSNQKLPQDIKYDHFDINKTANLLFADHPKGENRCNRKNLLPIEDNLKSEKSQFIDDESGADLVLNGSADLDGSNATEQVTETTTTATETGEVKLEQETSMEHESPEDISTRLLDQSSYTLKSQIVLENIDSKCTTHYEIARDNDYTKLVDTIKQSKRNCGLLKDLLNNIRVSSFKVVDLEEKRKQDMEENLSNVSGTSNTSGTNSEEDKGVPSTIGLTAPKSLHGRICEAAERCKKHWRLRKMESDYYYFSTLFGSLPFKVHVHPELGVVYSVQTFTNLEEKSKPICWYELKLFQRKLQNENLLSVLGTKFDIMTLLDYVYMTMEEIIHFHMNYIGLIKKYGVSHHFRMNEDYSISFEIINIRLMLHWLISINMSGLISKESVNAISKLGERVKEEDIKCIAENTPKGINFFCRIY